MSTQVFPQTQFLLSHEDIPTHWYNILADLSFNVPTERKPRQDVEILANSGKQITTQIPLSMYRQSISKDPYIEIPEEVRNEYMRWRPTPLYRAHQLERVLDTPAKIYYKFEGNCPSGSHKLNTALAQAYYYRQAGINHITTGTGAGQWGTALALACQSFGLKCTVYMVKCSYYQKPYRRVLMDLHGAEVIPSPSQATKVGRDALEQDPNTNGSLSIANAEAIEQALNSDKSRFSVGSGENHVLLHQTVMGQEALRQMELAGDYPDVVIASMGAGSNFAGLVFPFYPNKLNGNRGTQFIAVEPAACPKLTRGKYAWDYNDYSGVTPMTKMYTLGHKFAAPGIHAGGLRYHGAAPIVSAMYDQGLLEAVAYTQRSVFEAAIVFTKTEKFLPAPESAHAIRCAIDEAIKAKESGEEKVILFGLSGHGLLDLSAYEQYLSGEIQDCVVTDEEISRTLGSLPVLEEV